MRKRKPEDDDQTRTKMVKPGDLVSIRNNTYRLTNHIATLLDKPPPNTYPLLNFIALNPPHRLQLQSPPDTSLIKYEDQRELFRLLFPRFRQAPRSVPRRHTISFPLNSYTVSDRPFTGGGYGDVWHANLVSSGNTQIKSSSQFVIKRIVYAHDNEALMAARREVHFGAKLAGAAHVARFVEHFDDAAQGVFWLVFQNEGVSLREKLYAVAGGALQCPSAEWLAMKRDGALVQLLREIAAQLLRAVDECHARGVLHRDVKPANVLVAAGGKIRLADFGNAVDLAAGAGALYGAEGPGRMGGAEDYSPPEVLFSEIPFSTTNTLSYDIWSTGVVFLELILGTSDIFRVSRKAHAIINSKFSDKSLAFRRSVCKLKAFVEFGIYREPSSSNVAVSVLTKV